MTVADHMLNLRRSSYTHSTLAPAYFLAGNALADAGFHSTAAHSYAKGSMLSALQEIVQDFGTEVA